MPLREPVRSEAAEYARQDLPGDIDWHVDYFDFVSDIELRRRIGQEFYAARYLYKLWEGLRINEPWALQAQVQLQVQQYASIYEALIHYLLFTEATDEPEVQRLFEYRALVERPLPGHIMEKIRNLTQRMPLTSWGQSKQRNAPKSQRSASTARLRRRWRWASSMATWEMRLRASTRPGTTFTSTRNSGRAISIGKSHSLATHTGACNPSRLRWPAG